MVAISIGISAGIKLIPIPILIIISLLILSEFKRII